MPSKNSTKHKTNRARPIKKGTTPRNATKLKDLKDKPDNFLLCRSYRYHALDPIGLFYWGSGRQKGICRISQCTRCGTVREDYYLANGKLMDRKYERPEGYDLHGSGQLHQHEVVREYLARLNGEVSPDRDSLPAHPSVLR